MESGYREVEETSADRFVPKLNLNSKCISYGSVKHSHQLLPMSFPSSTFFSCLFSRDKLFQTFHCDSAFLLIGHSFETRTNSAFGETKEFKQRLEKKTKVMKCCSGCETHY